MRAISFTALSLCLALAAGPALAQSVTAYDETWHRANFWSGEYPYGFSVAKTTIVQLRPTLDPQAEKSVSCELPAGATYQPWNRARVEEQGLAFVSFTRIAEYKVTEPFEISLYRHDDGSEKIVSFERGDIWRYLVYFAEGSFVMEFDGVLYDAGQDMFDQSDQIGDASGYDEWLRINCPNNQWGWLFMGDISLGNSEFVSANIVEFGVSADLD